MAYPALCTGSFITLLTDDAKNIYSFGRMDQKNSIAVMLNQNSRGHSVMILAYQVRMSKGSSVIDQLTRIIYQVQDGQVAVDARGEGGVIL